MDASGVSDLFPIVLVGGPVCGEHHQVPVLEPFLVMTIDMKTGAGPVEAVYELNEEPGVYREFGVNIYRFLRYVKGP